MLWSEIDSACHNQIMALYVVICENAAECVQSIPEQDKCAVSPDAWFVRSDKPSTKALAESVGLSDKRDNWVVVSADFYWGRGDSSVVETFQRWERDARDK